MKALIFILSVVVSTLSFAGGEGSPLLPKEDQKDKTVMLNSGCYKITKANEGDCPQLAPPATQEKKEECEPKKEKPKPKPKKKTPKKKEVVKKCPKCPKCKTCKPKVKVVKYTQRQYIEKEVYNKHSLDLFVGLGPYGFVTDYYETEDRKNEYALRKEKDKSVGGVIGGAYRYKFSPSYNGSVLILSNETFLIGGGLSW